MQIRLMPAEKHYGFEPNCNLQRNNAGNIIRGFCLAHLPLLDWIWQQSSAFKRIYLKWESWMCAAIPPLEINGV